MIQRADPVDAIRVGVAVFPAHAARHVAAESRAAVFERATVAPQTGAYESAHPLAPIEDAALAGQTPGLGNQVAGKLNARAAVTGGGARTAAAAAATAVRAALLAIAGRRAGGASA